MEEDIDYKQVCESLERENVALRMTLLKERFDGFSFTDRLKLFFNEPENIGMVYGIGLLLTFIVLPVLNFLKEMGNDR